MTARIFKTRSEKFLAVTWLLIPVVIFGNSIYGWSIGDAWGGLLLSILPASFLASIAALVATLVETPLTNFAKRVWVAVAVISLLVAVMFASRSAPDAIKGADTLLAYSLIILAFPIALLVPFVLMAAASLWSDSSGVLSLSVMWLAFFSAGYLQWFVLLPWLWRKWKARRAGTNPKS